MSYDAWKEGKNGETFDSPERARAEGRVIDAMSLEAIQKKGWRGHDICEEALHTINGERQDQYGNPEDTFTLIGDLWAAYLGTPITPVQVADMMVLLKMAREAGGKGKRDNLVDMIGYAALGACLRGYDR